jgi:hypothetical protein
MLFGSFNSAQLQPANAQSLREGRRTFRGNVGWRLEERDRALKPDDCERDCARNKNSGRPDEPEPL